MTDSPAFRFARLDDVDEVVSLVERAYRGADAGWTTEAHLIGGRRTGADEVAALIAAPTGGLLTLRVDDSFVATCHIDRRDGHAWFGMFAVDPRMQARGYGRLLLSEAERVARDEWGATEMRMTVISVRTDLVAWYERRGYRATGATSPFPYGDERFGAPRVADLRFAELAKPLSR